MLEQAQAVLHADNLSGLGDAGYFSGEQLKRCEEQHITVYVAVPDKSKPIAKQGRFTRDSFNYDEQRDCYVCPQGETLNRFFTSTTKPSGQKDIPSLSKQSQHLSSVSLTKTLPERKISAQTTQTLATGSRHRTPQTAHDATHRQHEKTCLAG